MHQGCVFDPLSGHIQESTNECISKWNNKKNQCFALPLSKKINKEEKSEYKCKRTVTQKRYIFKYAVSDKD